MTEIVNLEDLRGKVKNAIKSLRNVMSLRDTVLGVSKWVKECIMCGGNNLNNILTINNIWTVKIQLSWKNKITNVHNYCYKIQVRFFEMF